MAIESIANSSGGNIPLELHCSSSKATTPLTATCTGIGTTGPFRAVFVSPARVPQFILAGQTSIDGRFSITESAGISKVASKHDADTYISIFGVEPVVSER